MRVKDVEQRISAMSGDDLLDTLVNFAAMTFDVRRRDAEDRVPDIVRAIQMRLAETGVARKHHGESCRFMLGDDRCPCSSAHWSWPQKGL